MHTPQLTFIEVKAGEDAVSGSSGISDHWEKTLNFIKKKNFTEFDDDVKKMIKQLSDFGLLNIPQQMTEILSDSNCEFNKIPQMVFILANINSTDKLLSELNKITEQPDKIDLRFAVSSFMGYGLYDNSMLTLDEFKKILIKKTKGE